MSQYRALATIPGGYTTIIKKKKKIQWVGFAKLYAKFWANLFLFYFALMSFEKECSHHFSQLSESWESNQSLRSECITSSKQNNKKKKKN